MNKRQIVASLNNIAEDLEMNGMYDEANQIAKVMNRLAQEDRPNPGPNTRTNIIKMLNSTNLNWITNSLITGNPVNQNHLDGVNKVKKNVEALSNILPLYLGKPL